LGWVEYGAEPGCDLDDQVQWSAANPGRVEVEAIVSERRELSPEDFAKERLNIWPTDRTDHVFGQEVWAGLAAARRDDIGQATAFGLDRSRDGLVVVAAAYRDFDTGATHVEVAFVRDEVTHLGEALGWIVGSTNRRVPIVIDAASTASPAIAHLIAAKRNVVVTNSGELCRACIGFTDDVRAGSLSHADSDNGDLCAAVDGARRRPVGDVGGYAWDRRDAAVAVSPLVAATLAHYGAVSHGRRPAKPRRVVVLS
jgi:hypothetical protein